MAYRGHIEGNIVVLDDKISLPDGTIVSIVPIEAVRMMTLAERYKDIIGIAPDLPPDMADNHDHYIHGTLKKWGRSLATRSISFTPLRSAPAVLP